ncbi:MAG TPA: IPT/TIG domain-containing protein, partial [Alphaproteobacteria bacterium]|nr:IPT/TIG domain-containing protein [Alphaproteobacteria bacterium]
MRPRTISLRLLTILAAGFLIAPTGAQAAAPAITSFSPSSGTIGTSVTIAGTGFTGTTSVGFAGAVADFKVMGNKKIVVTAPNNVATGKITVKSAKGTGTSKTNFTATPGADLSPSSGAPLATVTVSGAGFKPSTAVDIYFDLTEQALAITSARGTISMQIQVPASAQPGAHWVSL